MKRARPLPRLAELNPNLICVLCGGYYIDATALTECIHSFCKTCIVSYLKTNKHCPICQAVIHKTKSNQHLSSDKTLQDLVYKLVPGLYQNEMKRRREFYAKHPNEAPSKVGEARGDENERIWFSKDDIFSISLHYCPQSLKDERTVRALTLKEVVPSPAESQKDVRYLQCPAGVTVEILKRYIRWKYELPGRYEVDIFHTDECLRDDLTLLDVAYIYTWRRKEPLLLNYTVYEYIVKRIKVECPAPSRLLDLSNLVKSNSSSGCKVVSKPPETKPDTKPYLLPDFSVKHDDSSAEPMDVDEKKPDTAMSSRSAGSVLLRCKTEAPELKDVITEQTSSSSSASLSNISDSMPEVKTEARADDRKEEAGDTLTPCATTQKQTASTASSAQSTLTQTAGDCPTSITPSTSAALTPKAQICEKPLPQVVGSGITDCTETVQKNKATICVSDNGEKPPPVEEKREGVRDSNHCSIGVAKTQTSLGVSVNMPLTPVTKTPSSATADIKVLPTSVTKSVAQPPLTRPSQGTIASATQLPVSGQSPKSVSRSKPPTTEGAVPDIPNTTTTVTPVSSKSQAVKLTALSVPKLGPLAGLGVATTTISTATTTISTTTTTDSIVPSAAAAAGGAASPSPASQAASSSPSPPMASSAACVKDVLEPLPKAVDLASRQSGNDSSCQTIVTSMEATVKPHQGNTAITTTAEVPVEKVVTVSKAEVRLATSARSVNTTETKSADVGKPVYGTSSQSKPVPGVFMPSNPNTVSDGSKEISNVNKECKSKDEKPAVSTATPVVSVNSASHRSVASIAGGTLSGRNGMPAVVTKPARVNNASTSVNTLMNKAAVSKQQPPAVVKPVAELPLPPTVAQQTSAARPSADGTDGSSIAPTTSSSKQNGNPVVTSPGASGPVPKPAPGPQIKPQTSSLKQPPASRHTASSSPARQQGRRGLASSAAAASPSFRSPLPSAPVSSISGVPSPVCTESQPSVATSQPLPSLSTSSAPFAAAAMGRHGQNPFLLEQSYLSNPYFQLLHQQQLLSMLMARGQLPNSGALPMLNSLSAFSPQMLAQMAASHAHQHLLPETARKLQQQQHLQTLEADSAVAGKKQQQQHQAAVIGSTAAAKKNAESAARRKITDIANSLQKKARQTLSGASVSASSSATDSSTDKGGRPPYAHSISATSTTSTPPLTAGRGAGGRGRGEEDQPLNLVMSRGTHVAGSGKISNGLSQQPQPVSVRKTTT